MAKPCILSDSGLAKTLTEVPQSLLTTQDTYALALKDHEPAVPVAT